MNGRTLVLIAALTLAGCSSPPPAADRQPPLAGARIGAPFALTDQTGRRVTDRDFAGRYRIMYFGYTFCPDVCPTDLQVLGAGLKAFENSDPARGAQVVPIFVTVDPARDTPAVLKPFVAAFHPRMVGLTGAPAAIAALAKAYGVYFKLGPKQPGGGYLVDHSRQAYLMGLAGEPLALLPSSPPVAGEGQSPAPKSLDGTPQGVANELAKWVK